jgi:hypothetical protein
MNSTLQISKKWYFFCSSGVTEAGEAMRFPVFFLVKSLICTSNFYMVYY